MFGLFKKQSWEISGKAFDFFHALFNQLPSEFQFLSEGLNKGLYKSFRINHSMRGHYSIGFDPAQSDKSVVKERNFELAGIAILANGYQYPLNITIYEGLWIDFEIEKNVSDFNGFEIDLSKLIKINPANKGHLEKLTAGLSSDKLDLDDLGEFELEGEIYYQIKDLNDGNYIAIDKKGQVFGLFHDLYKIELISKSLKNFVEDVNSGGFDLEKYLEGHS